VKAAKAATVAATSQTRAARSSIVMFSLHSWFRVNRLGYRALSRLSYCSNTNCQRDDKGTLTPDRRQAVFDPPPETRRERPRQSMAS
jgi:hypothetical protein